MGAFFHGPSISLPLLSNPYQTVTKSFLLQNSLMGVGTSAFLTVIEAETKLLDEMDVVVPVDRIAEFLVYTHDEAEKQGVTVRSFGHAGDGNLHIYCCSNELDEEEFKRRVKRLQNAPSLRDRSPVNTRSDMRKRNISASLSEIQLTA